MLFVVFALFAVVVLTRLVAFFAVVVLTRLVGFFAVVVLARLVAFFAVVVLTRFFGIVFAVAGARVVVTAGAVVAAAGVGRRRATVMAPVVAPALAPAVVVAADPGVVGYQAFDVAAFGEVDGQHPGFLVERFDRSGRVAVAVMVAVVGKADRRDGEQSQRSECHRQEQPAGQSPNTALSSHASSFWN